MKNFKLKINLKWLIPFLILVVLLFVLPLCFFKKEKVNNQINCYNMNLIYDDQSKVLKGEEQVTYYNNSENMFTHIYFHLYPNAFRRGAKAKVVSSTSKEEAYPSGESYGNIKIDSVFDKKGDLIFDIAGEDENILEIQLPEPIYPDEYVVVNINFTTNLANINHRLGYGENTINLGNFYPIACVYEDGKGFCQSLYHSNGDPFYSDCSNYEVAIQYDSKFQIAGSGDLKNTEKKDKLKESHFQGKNIRDFCLVLSTKFDIVSKNVENTQVNYYGYTGDNNLNECLQVAVDALKTFNNMFGDYPYNQLSIVKSNFIHGGMEFPNLVLISDQLKNNDYNYVIIHEIAHQWWYGVVGNDGYNHAWLDEGLAEYSTLLFYRKNINYGENFDDMITSANNSYKLFEEVYTKVQGKVDGRMNRSLNQFDTEPEYVQCTYTKGVLLFNNIRQLIGDKKFNKSLQKYYKTFQFKNAKPEDLISIFVDYGGNKIERIFNTWLDGKVIFK